MLTFNIKTKAQSADDSVKGVTTQMFSPMKNSDATNLKSVFADSALLQTITKNKEGKRSVKNEPIRAD